MTALVSPSNGQILITLSNTGPQGPAGPGVPAGGTTGQVPVKNSGVDFDISWQNQGSSGMTLSQTLRIIGLRA